MSIKLKKKFFVVFFVFFLGGGGGGGGGGTNVTFKHTLVNKKRFINKVIHKRCNPQSV